MKSIIAILALFSISVGTFAAAPEQVTVTLNAQDKLGLEHVVAQHNAEAKARHDAEQAAKPEVERTAFAPTTEEQYLKARIAEVLQSYVQQYSKYRMELPENREFFEKATLLTEDQKAQLKALIDQAATTQPTQ